MNVWIVGLLLLAPGIAEHQQAYERAANAKQWDGAETAARLMAKVDAEAACDYLHGEFMMANDAEHQRLLVRVLSSFPWKERESFLEDESLSDDAEIAAVASRVYLKLKPDAAPELLEHSPHPQVRIYALRALAKRDPERAMHAAVHALQTEKDPDIRDLSYDLVSKYGDAKAARMLVVACGRAPAAERERAVQALANMPVPALAGLATVQGRSSVRLLAARVILSRASPPLRPALELLRKDRDRRVRLVAEVGLHRIRDRKGASKLAQMVHAAKTTADKHKLYEAVVGANVRDAELARALAAHVRTGTTGERTRAAVAFGVAGGPVAVPILKTLLKSKDAWQLAVGAARGLAATRAKGAIGALIESLKATSGRVQHEVLLALKSLTGVDFGPIVPNWVKWWDKYGEGFKVAASPPRPKAASQAQSRYAFYGIPLNSEAVAFVCDISGSMEGTPLATLQKELLSVLKRFPPTGRFNIICFETDIEKWSARLRPASPKSKAAARRFIGNMSTRGATNLWGGLMTAFGDASVDTIVLLSDGSPSAGKITDPVRITDEFLKRNRDRMIRVHVVCIGFEQPALRRLAKKTGGKFVVKKRQRFR